MNTILDSEMQDALRADAQKLRDQGVPVADVEFSDGGIGFASLDLIREIPLDDIAPDPAQARDEGADDSIGDTLQPEDVLPPIEVRAHPMAHVALTGAPINPAWMIVDGERRWRGSKKAGRATIRAIVNAQALDDGDRLLRQMALNDGKKLKPMEEARSWKRIMDAKGWKIKQLAEALHRPKSTVSDRLALLNAPAAFQPLFAKGVLTAAAAPIVRKYAELPERIVTKLVKEISSDDLHDFIQTETPIPLAQLQNALRGLLHAVGLRGMYNGPEAKAYEGEVFEADGQRWAIDAAAYEKHRNEYWAKQNARSNERDPSAAEKRRAAEQAAERKKQRAKAELRRAHFAALAAKLPERIDSGWGHLLVDLVMKEVHQDTLRVLAAQLGLTADKSRTGGMDRYGEAIRRHARSLTEGGRVQLALQLLLAPDLNIPSYEGRGADRLAAAAKLLKLDLSKIKPPADAKAKPEKPAKGAKRAPAGKKSPARKRSPSPVFMSEHQPSPALGAIVGDKPLTRTEITKKLWAHIKKHGLQDTKERRMINADAKLEPVFGGKKRVSMFEMTKLVNKHLKPVKD